MSGQRLKRFTGLTGLFDIKALLILFAFFIFGFSAKPALAWCPEGWQACADGCLASSGLPPGDSGARDYCKTHGGLGRYDCDPGSMPDSCYEQPTPPPPCNNYTTSSSQYCPSGYQTGSVTVQTTYNCNGSVVGQTSSDNCGCMSGYSWNGSTCAKDPPRCPRSTTSSSVSCSGGWQTGVVTTTKTTYEDCSISESVTDNCGCSSGYEWNGSGCAPKAPSCTPSVTSSPPVSCSAYGYQTGTITTTTRTYSDCSTSQSESGSCGCYSGYSWNGSYCEADATPENGSCGSTTNSCNSGSFGDIADSTTHYQWNCYGVAGGSSTGCAQAKPGQCGFANGHQYSSAPKSSSALCALGTSSSVSGSSTGPWSWTCTTSGGTIGCGSTYCAPPIAGSCDTNVNNGCSAGNSVDLADSSTHYLWQCTGLNGGADSSQCSKAKPPVIGGVCDTALNTCKSGTVNDTADDATNYNWQCLGSNSGVDANCTSPKPEEPACWVCQDDPTPYDQSYLSASYWLFTGKSPDMCTNGVRNLTVTMDPSDGDWARGDRQLCNEAILVSNPKTGHSNTVYCDVAPAKACGACHSVNYIWSVYSGSSEDSTYLKNTYGVKKQGTSCQGGGTWSCTEKKHNCVKTDGGYYECDVIQDCSCSTPSCGSTPLANGSCGKGTNSCASGIINNTPDDSDNYKWQCLGISGGAGVNCSQARPAPVQCAPIGSNYKWETVDGQKQWAAYGTPSNWTPFTVGFTSSSSRDHESGRTTPLASDVKFANGVTWKATPGTLLTCGAAPAPTASNGTCGSSINQCTSGALDDLADDSSNYKWQCTGLNGGSSASCVKAKAVAPTPVNGSCGSSNNNCDSGSLSNIADSSTDYLWNCVGSNGGSTDYCSESKPPSCSPTTTTETQSCGSGYTGNQSRSKTVNCNGTTTYGSWDTSGCTPVCSPTTTTETQACGSGYTGNQSRSKTANCNGTTTYGSWDTSGCTPVCSPTTTTETQACGSGYTGNQSRSKTLNCNGTTTYGSWDTSSCVAIPRTCTWQTTGNLSCGSQHFNLSRGSDCSAILGFDLGGSCSGSRSCDYGSWEGDGAPYGTCPTGTNRVYHGTVSCVCQ